MPPCVPPPIIPPGGRRARVRVIPVVRVGGESGSGSGVGFVPPGGGMLPCMPGGCMPPCCMPGGCMPPGIISPCIPGCIPPGSSPSHPRFSASRRKAAFGPSCSRVGFHCDSVLLNGPPRSSARLCGGWEVRREAVRVMGREARGEGRGAGGEGQGVKAGARGNVKAGASHLRRLSSSSGSQRF